MHRPEYAPFNSFRIGRPPRLTLSLSSSMNAMLSQERVTSTRTLPGILGGVSAQNLLAIVYLPILITAAASASVKLSFRVHVVPSDATSRPPAWTLSLVS